MASLFASCLFAGGCWTASLLFKVFFFGMQQPNTADFSEKYTSERDKQANPAASAISEMEGETKGHRQMVFACSATQKLLNKKSQVAKVEVLWRLEAAASCSCRSGDLLNLSHPIPIYPDLCKHDMHWASWNFHGLSSCWICAESLIVLQIGAFAQGRLRQHSLKMQWQLRKDIAINLISRPIWWEHGKQLTRNCWALLQAHETYVMRKKMEKEWNSYKDSKRRSYDSAKAQLRSHSQREESPNGSVLLQITNHPP